MKEIISRSKARIQQEKERVKNDLIAHLEKCDYSTSSTSLQIINIASVDDLQQVYHGCGFYVLMTTLDFDDNPCTFEIDEFKAIYRGHSYTTKDRIMSHLFNSHYHLTLPKGKTPYKVCLKIEDGVEGINIDQKPYSDYNWKVIIHKMPKSLEIIREQAELAFDEVYNRPIKSRERTVGKDSEFA